jgi:hypothetical protein
MDVFATEIALDELNSSLKELPLHKAAGPSTITYEDLKNLGPEMKQFL